MKKNMYSIAISLVVFTVLLDICFPAAAHAGYIDSGSGSALVQVIIAAAAGLGKMWHGFRRALGLGK